MNWYNQNADQVIAQYESIPAEQVHSWCRDLIPESGSIADIGGGTGRDAVWFASLGLQVMMVEPTQALLAYAKEHHHNPAIQWSSDTLPGLSTLTKTGQSFDAIFVTGVWMHIAPSDRERAFRKLSGLLKPGGRLFMSIRRGPDDHDRQMFDTDPRELHGLAKRFGVYIEREIETPDQFQRAGVSWNNVVFRLPDDGTDAFPTFRQIVLNDDKSSTYKLALLRTIARIADAYGGSAQVNPDRDSVSIPLGLVGLVWIRLFKPLIQGGFPQAPLSTDGRRLGFVKSNGVEQLIDTSQYDLRVGARFGLDRSGIVHRSIRDAVATITKMPAYYITYADGNQIFIAKRQTARGPKASLEIDLPYLWSFGEIEIPESLWLALRRYSVWIEPVVVSEWMRLTQEYAKRGGQTCDLNALSQAMEWSDPKRTTFEVRKLASRLADQNQLFCVWSGKRLKADRFDIDHNIPWSAWACNDLWNLLPTDRTLNQKTKREALPSAQRLNDAVDRMFSWWTHGIRNYSDQLEKQFCLEASSALPITLFQNDVLSNELIFEGVSAQRSRLERDQQLKLW